MKGEFANIWISVVFGICFVVIPILVIFFSSPLHKDPIPCNPPIRPRHLDVLRRQLPSLPVRAVPALKHAERVPVFAPLPAHYGTDDELVGTVPLRPEVCRVDVAHQYGVAQHVVPVFAWHELHKEPIQHRQVPH
ncbi:hypothetical protein PspLS_01668 [Pyricularia sp. CBS 133598]|nr:hypothetical protein PspLS_01668 [Pyricularia sp. CBS 133598]